MKWVHQFPTEPGWYWFAGERFKRNDFAKSKGEKPRYEVALCRIRKIQNGVVGICNGNFLYSEELGDEWFFATAELPAMPSFKEKGDIEA